MTAWNIVSDFSHLPEPTAGDVMRLECAFMNVLRDNKTDKHHAAAGYSKNVGRFLVDLDEPTDKDKLRKLRKHYWMVCKQQQKLEHIIRKREEAVQSVCQHVWEKDWDSRGGRSHYECKLCGKYR